MYLGYELAKATHDEKLRIAARDQLRGRARDARRGRDRDSSAGRLADLRILRGRRAVQAY